MEKYGVVKTGVTPEEKAVANSEEKRSSAADLDADFRKRAAEAAQKASNK